MIKIQGNKLKIKIQLNKIKIEIKMNQVKMKIQEKKSMILHKNKLFKKSHN